MKTDRRPNERPRALVVIQDPVNRRAVTRSLIYQGMDVQEESAAQAAAFRLDSSTFAAVVIGNLGGRWPMVSEAANNTPCVLFLSDVRGAVSATLAAIGVEHV